MLIPPPQTPPTTSPIVTVWIHGTKADECLPSPFARFAKKIGNIIFQHRPGFHHISTFDTCSYDAIRASILGTTAPLLFNYNYFYSFGWSGKLSLIARKNAAQELFQGLKQIHKEIVKKNGQEPEFVLISHSHGGNVILHMAEIEDKEGFNLIISKAILLACPVQKHTSHLIQSPIFKRVYSLHSHTDMIQIADMQGLHRTKHGRHKPFFSERHFNAHPKLIQACIRWKNCPTWHEQDKIIDKKILKNLTNGIRIINLIKKNRGLFHIEFQLLPFLRHLNSIIVHLDEFFEKDIQCTAHKHQDIIIEI